MMSQSLQMGWTGCVKCIFNPLHYTNYIHTRNFPKMTCCEAVSVKVHQNYCKLIEDTEVM